MLRSFLPPTSNSEGTVDNILLRNDALCSNAFRKVLLSFCFCPHSLFAELKGFLHYYFVILDYYRSLYFSL